MPDPTAPTTDPPVSSPPLSSPPPADQPPRAEPDPGERLRGLAREFLRTRNRALLHEYLRLRP